MSISARPRNREGPALHVQRFDDVHAFLERAGPWLGTREAEHNLIFGICSSLAEDPGFSAGPPLLAVVETDGAVVAAAIRTPPWNVVLSEVDEPGALGALVADLAMDHGPAGLPGVTGPAEHAGEFAGLWSARTGATVHLDIRERIFELTRVHPPSPSPGIARHADPVERELLVDWMEAFHVESHGRPAPTPAGTMVDGWLSRRSRTMWLWEVDGEAVSLCGIGMGTPNGFRIGPVYTPPHARGRGYASNLVAWVTQSGLDAGRRFGFLFTDLANPTSNHIYQAIGYEPVRDVDMWLFEAGG